MVTTATPRAPAVPVDVLLVDDHATFAESLAFVLDADPRFDRVTRVASLGEARAVARSTSWSLAVVDVALPDGDGTGLLAELRELKPHSRLVVLTAHPRSGVLTRAESGGADCVLAKGEALDRLLDVLAGERPAPPIDTTPPLAHALTARELDVVRLLAAGQDARRTAATLGVSVHTVRDHTKSLFAKLGVHSQVEAVVAAHRAGLINLDRV